MPTTVFISDEGVLTAAHDRVYGYDSRAWVGSGLDDGQDGGMVDGAELAVAFARQLRRAGIDVAPSSVVTFTAALDAVGLDDGGAVYWAGRTTLLRRPDDRAAYDEAFAAFWHRSPPASVAAAGRPAPALALDDGAGPDEPDAGGPGRGGEVVAVRYSPAETLRHQDLASCTPAEVTEAFRLIARIHLVPELRRSRRQGPAPGASGGRPDLRRGIRRTIRAGGEPVPPPARVRSRRPRRVVLLVDVSGSMEPYARALLRFAHVAVAGRAPVEAFACGTRLTRITRQLATRDPDAALAAATAAAVDRSGGTRLGQVVEELCSRPDVRGVVRGAVVVVLSDGWDRGDPAHLSEQMVRLRLVAHRVVWVNPLKASPGYAPLAAGMAAALPHVDHFVEGHSLASLEDLAELIRGGR